MRRQYQKEWHNILFESFAEISSTRIAGELFYASFYLAFFNKYSNPQELDPDWVKLKMQVVDFLKSRKEFGKDKSILSIGCGLGLVEKALLEEGYFKLEVTEISNEPLRWLLPHIRPEFTHIGYFPDCIPTERKFDCILLISADYFFNRQELIIMLKDVLEHLSYGGVCMIVSWSYEEFQFIEKIKALLKDVAKLCFERVGWKSRGQFWGYKRNRKDYYNAMKSAGFQVITDGLLKKITKWDTFWIAGTKRF